MRGEFHRHTELSWDGGPDGSLEDMFRYAIDAAEMDWIGNGDHDNGAGREYSWWLRQKFTDAYHVKDRFTPMFGYERSVAYPHGHRNCVFAQRGIRTLPRLADPARRSRSPASMPTTPRCCTATCTEFDGICASHTSATSMGTDWRDNDPQVEPLVEIYQGDRMSLRVRRTPRGPATTPRASKKPVQHRAAGIPRASSTTPWARRATASASSRRATTGPRTSRYCIVLAEKHDRESILDGMSKRHVYGATDDIISTSAAARTSWATSSRRTRPRNCKFA